MILGSAEKFYTLLPKNFLVYIYMKHTADLDKMDPPCISLNIQLPSEFGKNTIKLSWEMVKDNC